MVRLLEWVDRVGEAPRITNGRVPPGAGEVVHFVDPGLELRAQGLVDVLRGVEVVRDGDDSAGECAGLAVL